MSDDPTMEMAREAANYLRREQDITTREMADRLGCSFRAVQSMQSLDTRRFICRLAGQYGWKSQG